MVKRFVTSPARPIEARRMVRAALDGAPDSVVGVVELLSSELVTNAIVHGSSAPVFVLEHQAGLVRVEVRDSEPRLDLQPLQIESTREHGRGLAIVDAFASSWGVEPQTRGKVVWFQLNY